MHLNFRNVNDAFESLVRGIYTEEIPTEKRPSRNGDVLVIDEPVTITYERPYERVLFNQARDCNPFFHLYEALWMLAGREDVASLAKYSSKIAQYSDDGKIFHGAYGYRWRKHFWYPAENENHDYVYVDQIAAIIKLLRKDPTTRRVVLQMWDPGYDLAPQAGYELPCSYTPGLDFPCNQSALFSISEERGLDMTVFNRSNDLILGCLGANYVHFGFLHEYVARKVGVEVGRYNQISNNLHVYTWNWKPKEWLAGYDQSKLTMFDSGLVSYDSITPVPLMSKENESFDNELEIIVDLYGAEKANGKVTLNSDFLWKTVRPMLAAFAFHKRRDYGQAKDWLGFVEAEDWRIVGQQWIEKRRVAWAKKNAKTKVQT